MNRDRLDSIINQCFEALNSGDYALARILIGSLPTRLIDPRRRASRYLLLAKLQGHTEKDIRNVLENFRLEDPENVFLLCFLGDECLSQKDTDQAREYSRLALEKKPDCKEAQRLRRRVMDAVAEQKGLLKAVDKQSSGERLNDCVRMVASLRKGGNYGRSLNACIELYHSKFGANGQALSLFLDLIDHLRGNDRNRARQYITRIIRELDPAVVAKLAVHYRIKDNVVAKALADRTQLLFDQDPAAYDRFEAYKARQAGDVLRQTGDIVGALENYQKSLALRPDDFDVIQGVILVSLEMYWRTKRAPGRKEADDVTDNAIRCINRVKHPHQLVNLLKVAEKRKYPKLEVAIKSQMMEVIADDVGKSLLFAKYYLSQGKNGDLKMARNFLRVYLEGTHEREQLFFDIARQICTRTDDFDLASRAFESATANGMETEVMWWENHIVSVWPEVQPNSLVYANVIWKDNDVRRTPVDTLAFRVSGANRIDRNDN